MWSGARSFGKSTTLSSGKSGSSEGARTTADSIAAPRSGLRAPPGRDILRLADGRARRAGDPRSPPGGRGAHRGALRAALPGHRGGAPARAAPLRGLLCGRDDPDPPAPRGPRRRAQVLEPGEHAVPRAGAPATLQPRSALPTLLRTAPGVRAPPRHLPARSRARAHGPNASTPAGAGRAARRGPTPALPVRGQALGRLLLLVVLLEGVRALENVDADVVAGDGLVEDLAYQARDRDLVVLGESVLEAAPRDRELDSGLDPDVHDLCS